MASLLDDVKSIFGGLTTKPTVTGSDGKKTKYDDRLSALKAYAADPANNSQLQGAHVDTQIPDQAVNTNPIPDTVAAPQVAADPNAAPLPDTIANPNVAPPPAPELTAPAGNMTYDPMVPEATGTTSLDNGGHPTLKGQILGTLIAGGLGGLAGAGQRTVGGGFQQAMTLPLEIQKQKATNADLEAQAAQRQAAVANLPVQQQQASDLNAATVEKDKAMAEMYRGMDPIKAAKAQADAAGKGLMPVLDAAGNVKYVDDPNSAVYKQRVAREGLLNAQASSTQAQEELRNAQAVYQRERVNPDSPAFKQAEERLRIAAANSGAANLRAKAYWGNYVMHSQGLGLDGQPLNGVGMLDGSPVGTTMQGTVNKMLPKAAQFADVYQGLDHTDQTIAAFEAAGHHFSDPTFATALADPHATSAQWAQGLVKSDLDPIQRDTVIAIKGMQERIMAARGPAGSGISDSQVQRLQAMLPNASTPDYDYAHRQLQQVGQQLDLLATGLPQLNRAPHVGPTVPATSHTTGTSTPAPSAPGKHAPWFHPTN